MMTMTLRSGVAVIAIVTSGASSAEGIDGLYQPSGSAWSCSPDQIGMDGGALAIQNGILDGVGNRCDLTAPVVIDGGTRYTAICFAEGSEYQEDMSITPTANGIKLERNGSTVYWRRCAGVDQPAASEVARAAPERWIYSERTASVVADGNQFALSCDIFNASSTYPTAILSVPCPLCWPGEATSYTLRVDDGFAQPFEFERISNAGGSVSDLGYAPNWDAGVVRALMAGSVLEVVEADNVIASFPLAGSSRAIGALRASCN